MTKERRAHVVTVTALILIVAGGLLWRWGRAVPKEPPAPQDAVYGMLDAARNGDVAQYLASYTGTLRESLRQSAQESTPAVFAKYLRDSNALLKGVAVGEPQPLSGAEVALRVEYVYQDRNEVQ